MLFSKEDLRRLLMPLMLEQLLAVTIGMMDTMMVSTCGEAAVSGISLVDSINVLLINMFSALATGGAVVASQYLGRKERENASMASKQLFYTILLVSGTIMVIFLALRYPLAETDLWTHRSGRHGQRGDIFPYHGNFLSVPGALQCLRSAAPRHGQCQGIADDVPHHEYYQCGGECHLDLWLRLGSGRCRHRNPGLPHCGRGGNAKESEQTGQPDSVSRFSQI